jgi:nicotinamide-nucleotide amidase
VRAIILSIGSELVSGLRLDTHSADIARALTALGIDVLRHETVDDHAEPIAAALARAAAEADLIVATGGLGPTLDDCTRDGLALAMGEPLELDAAALAHLDAWARSRGRTLSESNRRQALLPRGCQALPNPVGTAPGITGRVGRATAFFMPGVPGEMALMLDQVVLPRLRVAAPGRVTVIRTLHTFGLPESVVGEKLSDLMALGRRPHVGTAVHGGMIDIHIYATGGPAEVEALLEADARAVRKHLGAAVFAEGRQRMEDAVADLLAARRATVAVAESCTGGLIAATLVNVPGISGALLESVVAYSNASKVRRLGVPEKLIEQHGAVSEPVVRAMAEGARREAGADFGLAVTGIAGPGGGSPEKPVGTVWTAVADAQGTETVREVLLSDRALVRERAANGALNLLRLRLLAATAGRG